MTVKALCEKYSLKFQTVYRKISNHKDKELAGHITKVKGASLELDDFAVDFLLPTHVKVMQAIEECEGIARENEELKDKLESAEIIAEQTDNQLSKALADNKKCLPKLTVLKAAYQKRTRKTASFQNSLKQNVIHTNRLYGSLKIV